jgi:hypothetical protein
MRGLALLLFVTACGARATGPAWPKSAGTERVGEATDDGGESLAPRAPQEAVAIEGPATEDVPAAAPAAAPAAKPAAAPENTTAPAPAGADPSVPIILDYEETIEIDAK